MTDQTDQGFALRGELDGVAVVLPLLPGINHLGSAPSCNLCLKTAGVSKHHADLQVEGSRVSVVDLASKNGTFVNRRRVDQVTIAPGDRIVFGAVSMALEEIDPDEARIAVDLGIPQRKSARLPTTETRSGAPFSGGDDSTGLSLATSFIEALGPGDATDPCSRALRFLAREVPLKGLCLFSTVDGSDGSEPVLSAAVGDIGAVDVAAVAAALASPFRGDTVEIRLPVTEAEVRPMLLLADPLRRRGLLAWGDRVGTPEVDALLRLVFAITHRLVTAETRLGHRADKATELVFPDGYVVGESQSMVNFYRQLQPVVFSDLPILVLGETGTGKESVAQILHASSDRSRRPLVTLNCAAIPHDLIEAELFGIGGGVATGVSARAGKFQEADKGTLFLDEIGDLPLSLQAKLLRALQDGEVRPVGLMPERVDARIVAATNGDLEAKMEAGLFRRDLYYRLAGLVVHLPPLRRRVDDLPSLVAHFLRRETERAEKPIRGLTVGAMKKLSLRPWPGNVRELEHEVRRLVYAAGPNQLISADMVKAPTVPNGAADQVDFRQVECLDLAEIEKSAMVEALRRSDGQVTEAARRLGITRQTLRRRMRRHSL